MHTHTHFSFFLLFFVLAKGAGAAVKAQ